MKSATVPICALKFLRQCPVSVNQALDLPIDKKFRRTAPDAETAARLTIALLSRQHEGNLWALWRRHEKSLDVFASLAGADYFSSRAPCTGKGNRRDKRTPYSGNQKIVPSLCRRLGYK